MTHNIVSAEIETGSPGCESVIFTTEPYSKHFLQHQTLSVVVRFLYYTTLSSKAEIQNSDKKPAIQDSQNYHHDHHGEVEVDCSKYVEDDYNKATAINNNKSIVDR